MLLHNGEKTFQCFICEAKFFRNSFPQKTHVNTHGESKPFHCEICGAKFSRRKDLSKYTCQYTLERNFPSVKSVELNFPAIPDSKCTCQHTWLREIVFIVKSVELNFATNPVSKDTCQHILERNFFIKKSVELNIPKFQSRNTLVNTHWRERFSL